MPLTRFGEILLARSQIERAKSFLGAAILVRQRGGDEYVALHLICQAVEIAAKAALMAYNFKKHNPKKLAKKYNHDLARLIPDTFKEFDLKPLRTHLRDELEKLNAIYVKHWFRYPSVYNILVDSKTISSELVFFRLVAAIRLINRELARS